MKGKKQTAPAILIAFAQSLGTELKSNRLDIPEKFGSGYCTGFVFNAHIRLLISNYELKDELVVNNPDINKDKRMLFFKFQHVFSQARIVTTKNNLVEMPSVLIATSRINTDEVISIHTNTATINIEIDADYLNQLFDLPERSPVLKSLLENKQPLLFEQVIYPSLQRIVDQIVTEPVNQTFELFFLRIKAEELICMLLIELEKRSEKRLYPLNDLDIQSIYKVKDQMLKDLKIPPMIDQLAISANMSPTKLKRLFRQIFGNSIFNYYQELRMKEAARLLKVEKVSVSVAGYRLGFTNLSHFSRVFAAQMGTKPKQYSRS